MGSRETTKNPVPPSEKAIPKEPPGPKVKIRRFGKLIKAEVEQVIGFKELDLLHVSPKGPAPRDITRNFLRPAPRALAPDVELVRKAFEIIGSPQGVAKWMRTPLKALHDRTPYSLLGSEKGRKEVDRVLGRIEHGIY